MESEPWLPAASKAVMVITLLPFWSGIPDALHHCVPLAMPLPPRSFDHRTCVTPTLSAAAPPIATVDDVDVNPGLVVGELIETVGRIVSESLGVVRPSFADGLIWREAL